MGANVCPQIPLGIRHLLNPVLLQEEYPDLHQAAEPM